MTGIDYGIYRRKLTARHDVGGLGLLAFFVVAVLAMVLLLGGLWWAALALVAVALTVRRLTRDSSLRTPNEAHAARGLGTSLQSLLASVRAAGPLGWTFLAASVISWLALPVLVLLAFDGALPSAPYWFIGYLVLMVLRLLLFKRLSARLR